MAKTMAEVLAEHQISLAWENGEDRGITCLCGLDLPTEQERGEIDMTFLAAHQSAALSAAGYGLVADAKRSLELAALLAYEAVEASTIEQAKAEAWDEGTNTAIVAMDNHIAGDRTAKLINPYRKASNDDQ